MANPSTADWPELVRLTRYLIVRPRCVYHFPLQDEGFPAAFMWTPTSPGACTLGVPRAEGCASEERVPSSI
eukprot:9988132-Alexandrium_andersonii.AAC.1